MLCQLLFPDNPYNAIFSFTPHCSGDLDATGVGQLSNAALMASELSPHPEGLG